MVNRVVLVGRLTADPEMKYTPQGVAVTEMRIAVDRIARNEQGEKQADFFNVVAWRRTAEFASTYLTKGRLIAVDGRLQYRSWEAKDGTRRSAVEVVADNVESLDRPRDGQGGEMGHAPAPDAAPEAAAPAAPSDADDPFADE